MFIEILSPREIFPLPQKILKLTRGVGLPSFLTLRELTTNASQPFVLSPKLKRFYQSPLLRLWQQMEISRMSRTKPSTRSSPLTSGL